MNNRIEINGEWYVKETSSSKQQINPTFFLGVSSGKFEFYVLLKEDNSKEIWEGTQYIVHKDSLSEEIIDNEAFLREFRDNKYDASEVKDFCNKDLEELRQLLILVTSKGWL